MTMARTKMIGRGWVGGRGEIGKGGGRGGEGEGEKRWRRRSLEEEPAGAKECGCEKRIGRLLRGGERECDIFMDLFVKLEFRRAGGGREGML
jgi:hypothetical protein